MKKIFELQQAKQTASKNLNDIMICQTVLSGYIKELQTALNSGESVENILAALMNTDKYLNYKYDIAEKDWMQADIDWYNKTKEN